MPRCDRPCVAILWLLCYTIFQFSCSVARNLTDILVDSHKGDGNITLSLDQLPTDVLLNATGTGPRCSSIQGIVLNAQSCEELRDQVPDINTALVDWRGQNIELPARWSSCMYCLPLRSVGLVKLEIRLPWLAWMDRTEDPNANNIFTQLTVLVLLRSEGPMGAQAPLQSLGEISVFIWEIW